MAKWNGYDDYETGYETWDYNKLSKADKAIYDKKATVHSEKEVAKILKDIESNKKEVKTMALTVTKSKPVAKKKYSSKEKAAYYMGAGIALAKGNKANSILNEGDAKITRSARKGFLSVTNKSSKKS